MRRQQLRSGEAHQNFMRSDRERAWLSKAFKAAAAGGFERAYQQVRVDQGKYLRHLQRAHRLPVQSWEEMFLLGSGDFESDCSTDRFGGIENGGA